MAEEKKDAAAAEEPKPSGPSKAPMIVALSNLLVVLGTGGMLFYVKMVYKRPSITESGERIRLAQAHASPVPAAAPGYLTWEPVTVNIEPVPGAPKPADGTTLQLQGKLHYATVGISFEIRDISRKDVIAGLQPIIMDRLLGMLGRRSFQELITVQGRYLIRTQVLDFVNQLAARQAGPSDLAAKDGLVTNVFFTQFIVQ